MPVAREMMERYQGKNTVGVKVVVGSDDREKLEAMAEKVGANTFLDPDGSFSKAAGGKGVPHWYVVNEGGNLVTELGGFAPLPAILQELGLP